MSQKFKSQIDAEQGIKISNELYDGSAEAGSSGQVLSSTGSATQWIDSNSETAERIEVTVKNVSGGSLAKGVVVHAAPTATPPSGNVIEVIEADANDAAKMPAIGVLNETIADEAEGAAVMFGAVSGIDTSSFTIGDELYVSETAGEFTATKPTAFSSQVQKIAVVIKSHASNGLIKIFGAGRSNDVPNKVERNINFTETITSTKDGIALQMDGGSSAEGIRLQADSSTTYAVFLRSINPASGETSPWLYQENSPEWGIWHNNPINSFDFTRNGSISGAIETDVGGETNSVMIRLNNTDGSGTFVGNISGAAISGTTGTFSSIANATTDTDKFLVSDSGVIKYRTGAEVASDILGNIDDTFVRYDSTLQTTSEKVMVELKNTVTDAGGYGEIHILNDNDDKIVVGSIGSGYTGVDWTGATYVYNLGTGRKMYIKSQDELRFFSGGNSITANTALVLDTSQNASFTGTITTTEITATSTNPSKFTVGGIRAKYLSIYDGAATQTGGLYMEKTITGAGTSTSTVLFTETGNNLQFATNGSVLPKMLIDTDGDVGIGKINPDAPLVVYRTGDVWHTVIGNDTGQLRIGGQNGSGAVIQSRNQAGTVFRDLYLQRDGGNVGIGNNYANARLSLGQGVGTKLLVYDGGGNGYNAGFLIDKPAGNDFMVAAHHAGDLVLGRYTNSGDIVNVTSRLRIKNNGYVLIGTDSADNQLTVKGANCIIDAQSTADSQTIGFRAGYLNNADLCGFFRYTTADAQLYIDNNFTGNNGVYSDINFRNKANGGTSLINRMKIKGSSGYVGIATDDPLHNLQIGTAATNGDYSMMIEGNFADNAKSSNPRLNLIDQNFGITAGKYGSGSTDDALGIFAYQGTGRGIVFAHTTAGNTTSLSGMRQDMFIDGGTGRVGINTVDPSAQLDVYQGNIRRSGINSGSYLEIGDLPGYPANGFASLTSGGTIHFSNNGKYCAYLEGGNTYFGILNGSSQTRVFLNTSGNSYLTGGNFGVGVSTPDTPLAVYQTGDVWHAKIGNDSGQIRFGGQTGSGAVIQSRTNTGTVRDLYIQRDGGNVGIHVNNARTKLHIGPLSGGNATAQERLRLSGDYAGTGSGALLRFTNQHNSGSNPNSGEYNLAGIIAYDFRSDWGGAIALQTAPNTSAGGTLVNRLVINPEGRVGIANSNPGYTLDVTGTIRATSDVIAFSDRRVKENIVTIDGSLEKVIKLRGVSYTRKDIDDKSTKVGVIAQEVLKVLPEVVEKDEEGNYSVAYGNMAGVFIEAIKELKAEVDSLKEQLKNK